MPGYREFLNELKTKIRNAQLKAAMAASRELIHLYWDLGKDLVKKQENEGWGSKVLEKVAKDLQNEFPGIDGFSRSNIFRMRAFYLAYPNCLTAVRQLHIMIHWHPLSFKEGSIAAAKTLIAGLYLKIRSIPGREAMAAITKILRGDLCSTI